jgi:hypothetical protein
MHYGLVRDSSAVRRLFVRLTEAVGRQSAIHKENSGFAASTQGRHVSWLSDFILNQVNAVFCKCSKKNLVFTFMLLF